MLYKQLTAALAATMHARRVAADSMTESVLRDDPRLDLLHALDAAIAAECARIGVREHDAWQIYYEPTRREYT